MRTEYEFVLPRGYVDESGTVHKRGIMRLATARDELEPLRDPTITGPDDPRLTILVLTRVVQTLGDMELVTPHEIEGLFAADLAYLQDFYGVINFGSDDDIDALLEAQAEATRTSRRAEPAAAPTHTPAAASVPAAEPVVVDAPAAAATWEVPASEHDSGSAGHLGDGAGRRGGRRPAIEEVSNTGR